MDKYQTLFLSRLKEQLNAWEAEEQISREDIERFLHSTKGTAPTIGLKQIGERADCLYIQFQNLDEINWKPEELFSFLQPLLHFAAMDEGAEKSEDHSPVEGVNETILIIDDDITLLNVMRDELEAKGYGTAAFIEAEKALEKFYDLAPDGIVLDLHMPDTDGLQVLTKLRDKADLLLTPIIIVSADDTVETRVNCYKAEVDDFIAKPFDREEFFVRVKAAINRKKVMRDAVLIDELTGAYNRKFLKTELARRVYELERFGHPVSIVSLDLDHFKRINDSYGHDMGDEVLRGFAAYILKEKRRIDCLIRTGGEEFLLLLPYTKSDQAEAFANRLLEGFRKEVFHKSGEAFSVHFSSGIVEITNSEKKLDSWLEMVDQALYQAKTTGRNRVVVHDGGHVELGKSKDKLRVTIVDDDPLIREMLEEHFSQTEDEQFDFHISAFREGEELLQSDWLGHPEKYLVILDGMMPRMDGVELLKIIRERYEPNQYVCLMLTGRKAEKDIVRALELGTDDYMSKPFSLKEFQARVKRLLKRMN